MIWWLQASYRRWNCNKPECSHTFFKHFFDFSGTLMQECLSGNGEQDVSLFNVLFGKHAIFGYCTLFTYVHLKKLISTVSVVNKYKSPFKGKSRATWRPSLKCLTGRYFSHSLLSSLNEETSNSPKLFIKLAIKFHIWNTNLPTVS